MCVNQVTAKNKVNPPSVKTQYLKENDVKCEAEIILKTSRFRVKVINKR